MTAMLLLIEVLRAVLLIAGGALWAASVAPRGRDPRQRWRVRLASACLAALIAGSVLLGTDPWGVVILAGGIVGLVVSADDSGLDALTTRRRAQA